MMTGTQFYTLELIIVMAVVTVLLRFLPFLVFSKGTPNYLKYLGDVLPYACMAMLVVYCLKGIDLLKGNHGIPELIAIIVVVMLHKCRHNTLLSIACGTILYMVLVQVVFV